MIYKIAISVLDGEERKYSTFFDGTPKEVDDFHTFIRDLVNRKPEAHNVQYLFDALKKAELFDANLLLINQFAIVDGKHYWKGEELEEMKEDAEKWAKFDKVPEVKGLIDRYYLCLPIDDHKRLEETKSWWLKFNQCIDSEAVKDELYKILFPEDGE